MNNVIISPFQGFGSVWCYRLQYYRPFGTLSAGGPLKTTLCYPASNTAKHSDNSTTLSRLAAIELCNQSTAGGPGEVVNGQSLVFFIR